MFLDRFLKGRETAGDSQKSLEHIAPPQYFDGPRIDDLVTTFGRVVNVKNITPLSE